MSDIVNLKQFKKQKARKQREEIAQQNRVTFGRTLAEKRFFKAQADKANRFLDQNRLEKNGEGKKYP